MGAAAPRRLFWCRTILYVLSSAVLLAGCTGPAGTTPAATSAPPAPATATPLLPLPSGAAEPSFSSGPLDIPTTGPSASAAPRHTGSDPEPARSVAAFLSPSKNIECGTIPDGGRPTIACQIFSRTFTRPSCSGRQTHQAGSSVVVYLSTTGRPTVVACASDVAVPATPKSSAYGDRFAFQGGTRCAVSRRNVQCSNAGGHGFALAREALTTH